MPRKPSSSTPRSEEPLSRQEAPGEKTNTAMKTTSAPTASSTVEEGRAPSATAKIELAVAEKRLTERELDKLVEENLGKMFQDILGESDPRYIHAKQRMVAFDVINLPEEYLYYVLASRKGTGGSLTDVLQSPREKARTLLRLGARRVAICCTAPTEGGVYTFEVFLYKTPHGVDEPAKLSAKTVVYVMGSSSEGKPQTQTDKPKGKLTWANAAEAAELAVDDMWKLAEASLKPKPGPLL
ncbi:hypothetical protein Micbo1qcDRAFT_206165 [Microdochium bolleyi]|uniref:Uncharacterized protein n=1 Tax=Microdochium bolleyi TaxID=196109 RepID=A0A136IYE1_9PEZI|nr:hypothetical protein Micbo1qcDRAFT_206165 [Microdochium bolleyi]